MDVHSNPGPAQSKSTRNLKICNLNVHSIKVPQRFDLIKEKLAPTHDIITVTETWLKPSIPDSKFSIPDFYGPFRLDRPEGRAGGSFFGQKMT